MITKRHSTFWLMIALRHKNGKIRVESQFGYLRALQTMVLAGASIVAHSFRQQDNTDPTNWGLKLVHTMMLSFSIIVLSLQYSSLCTPWMQLQNLKNSFSINKSLFVHYLFWPNQWTTEVHFNRHDYTMLLRLFRITGPFVSGIELSSVDFLHKGRLHV